MKRLFLILALLCQLTISVAQQADFQKAVAKYKTAKTVTATATSTFTMTVKGKKHTTSSEKNTQFRSFQTVFESILSGGAKDISKLGDLTTSKQGNTLQLTITPQADSKKAARRMMFSSFVLTIDTKTSELQSLRLNERGGYTEYTFSGYQFK